MDVIHTRGMMGGLDALSMSAYIYIFKCQGQN